MSAIDVIKKIFKGESLKSEDKLYIACRELGTTNVALIASIEDETINLTSDIFNALSYEKIPANEEMLKRRITDLSVEYPLLKYSILDTKEAKMLLRSAEIYESRGIPSYEWVEYKEKLINEVARLREKAFSALERGGVVGSDRIVAHISDLSSLKRTWSEYGLTTDRDTIESYEEKLDIYRAIYGGPRSPVRFDDIKAEAEAECKVAGEIQRVAGDIQRWEPTAPEQGEER